MKIAVTAQENHVPTRVDPRFGRTAWFAIFDTDTESWEWLANDQALNLPQGAGIQAARHLVEHGVAVVLTGHCGPKAFRTLNAAGVPVVVDITGTVEQAVEQYRAGSLRPTTAANVEGHW